MAAPRTLRGVSRKIDQINLDSGGEGMYGVGAMPDSKPPVFKAPDGTTWTPASPEVQSAFVENIAGDAGRERDIYRAAVEAIEMYDGPLYHALAEHLPDFAKAAELLAARFDGTSEG